MLVDIHRYVDILSIKVQVVEKKMLIIFFFFKRLAMGDPFSPLGNPWGPLGETPPWAPGTPGTP